VLPVRGVSRRHALVRCGPEGLALEDVGSKNGTLVNGVHVQRTLLQAGDEVRLGPVTLRLEAVEPDDAALAISLGEAAAVPGLGQWDTTATSAREPGRIGLELVERLIARLVLAPEPDLTGLVSLLERELQAESACVFELRGGEPIVLAASGVLPDLGGHAGFAELARRARTASGGDCEATLPGEPVLSCALSAGPGPERLGLLVAGTLGVSRSEAETLLRILLGLARRLRAGVLAAAAAVRSEERSLSFPEGYVPGESPAMRAFYAQLRPLLQGDLPVLLLGETGVGKECLARILHLSSPRRSGPFVAVNCAAIPGELLEAELFGIAKGVATGVTERAGRFQQANGGTLLLDEIGDMPLELQAKLLRALQEKEIQPVGGTTVPVNLRVISATNSDLAQRIEAGRFRRDLYFRVAGFALRVPPLRERREDVPALTDSFLRSFGRETGKNVRGITVKALRALIEYSWPGNVRELEHEVRRLVYLCPEGEALDSTMLSAHLLVDSASPDDKETPLQSLDLEKNVDALERRVIREALARASGNRTKAAKLLGISRNGLAIKMERFGLA
jgi:DNA-binding NtrC family response regulator